MVTNIGRKVTGIVLVILFIGMAIIPSTVSISKDKVPLLTRGSRGYIQGLIDNASDGDTIYVPSGIYYENIIINKSISLVGENKDITIIDGGGNGSVMYISVNKATVSDFTIQNGNEGIEIMGSEFNFIKDNIIKDNERGIIIIAKIIGILPPMREPSSLNIIKRNNISNNGNGIFIQKSGANLIIKNNFLNNEQEAFFSGTFWNCWKRNYWNEPRILPKIIFGEIEVGQGNFEQWVNIDWRPAKEPYDL